MSEVMLHGVLNMPIDLWSDSELDKIQRHARYVEASELIKSLEAELAASQAETEKKAFRGLRRMVSSEYKNSPNWHLYAELFATGSTTAWKRVDEMGFDPDADNLEDE